MSIHAWSSWVTYSSCQENPSLCERNISRFFFPTVKRQPNLVAYSDANWGGDPDSRRSISGFCVFFAGSLILWSSKKQRTVSRSSAKEKYRAMSDATAERTWYRHLLSELGIKPNGLTLLCDNQSAIKLASNPLFHARSKHIELDCHFVRKKVEDSLNCWTTERRFLATWRKKRSLLKSIMTIHDWKKRN